MQHQSKLPNVGTSIFSIMSRLASTHNAINLAQGFPNFKSDQKLIDLVSNAMNKGHNQYAPMPGVLPLRKAVVNKFELLYNTSYHPETEITITAGATQAIYTAIAAFVKQDDEVIIFCPAYDCYAPAIEVHGGKVIPIQLESPDYKVNWEEVAQKISPKTKMIVINTPHNPSGTLLLESDMLQLQQLTKNTNIIILSDEVYEHIIFDNERHQSVCLFKDLRSRSLITASFGKTFHNTGWKMGYCCGPEELMAEFRKIHQFNVFSVNHPVQIGLSEYLNDASHYQDLSGFYQQKRDLFLKLIRGSRFSSIPSKGTYFQLLDFSGITQESDTEFANRLTMENGLASIPVSVFNENELDQRMLRFCFAKTDDTLEQAAEIICSI